ncbi:hypothetical protein FXO38_31365 [Capsicum annuum]|uniref:Retrovirus-related Pol polyprotein from transposon TNT 1-94-like beta-barrel domain-containing protein n=1 Tax=Capsicum annuum TaxID=4072 RepID=A0A2G2YRK3_CAPAN|nr:hypothetical protein FXO38_31365 [Capsicum annuum]PHT72251.1 hypothetical protein T459_23036 [Capsicum annuum]
MAFVHRKHPTIEVEEITTVGEVVTAPGVEVSGLQDKEIIRILRNTLLSSIKVLEMLVKGKKTLGHQLVKSVVETIILPSSVFTGASTHMTNTTGNLSNLKPNNRSDKIVVGSGHKLNITHVGKGTIYGLKLSEVIVVPKLKKNLLSGTKTDTTPLDLSHMATFYEFLSESQGESIPSGHTSIEGEVKVDHVVEPEGELEVVHATD